MLWEGIGANAELEAGAATLTLSMDNATATDDPVDSPEAKRMIDLIVLQPNQTDGKCSRSLCVFIRSLVLLRSAPPLPHKIRL